MCRQRHRPGGIEVALRAALNVLLYPARAHGAEVGDGLAYPNAVAASDGGGTAHAGVVGEIRLGADGAGRNARSSAVPLPLETANTTVSQPMITLLLIACPLLPFIIMAIFKGNRLPSRSRGAAWVCGYDHEQSMVITAHGFAMPVKEAFAPALKLRKWLNPVSLVPGWQNAAAPVLFRRLALIELAVLVVIVVSRGA